MSKHSVIRVDSVDNFIKEKLLRRDRFDDDPFIVNDLSKIQQRFDGWTKEFPSVEPFFALKAQHNAHTVRLMAANNSGFDAASLNEMKSALEAGCNPDKILYAQPYKQPSHLLFALQNNITSVCDSVDEIVKVGEIASLSNCKHPRILIRILPDDKEGDTQATLSSKFGAPIILLSELVRAANKGNVTVVGISFHVGSHCHTSVPYHNTLKLSRIWWNRLEKELGYPLILLDIGGGYPGESGPDFSHMAKRITCSIVEFYGDIREKIRIIAEPGRYMVTGSISVVVNVIAEKHLSRGSPGFVLNTGVYGGLSHSIWDKRAARNSKPYIVRDEDCSVAADDCTPGGGVVLWGPTCDSSDKLVDGYQLSGLKRGDWVVFPDLGAYGHNIMTTFNGFPHPDTFYVRSEAAITLYNGKEL